MRAAIIGLAGLRLTQAEVALLRDEPPAGVILFGRNIHDPGQLSSLTAEIRACLPQGAVIAVDQEGGRVARLRPPHWRAHPAAAAIATLEGARATRAAFLTGALIGLELAQMGCDLACAPVLDLRHPGASDVVGDRSYGSTPDIVVPLARAMADGLMAAGIVPVAKHAPGHGQARTDSHLELPTIPGDADLAPDIAAFRACADLPWMMTAHLLYLGLDPDRPGTLSSHVIGRIIRSRIGFTGVLVSDDLAMKALDGAPGDLAAAAIAAGCDVALHCTGDLHDNRAVLSSVPVLDRARWDAARAHVAARHRLLDEAALAAERADLLAC